MLCAASAEAPPTLHLYSGAGDLLADLSTGQATATVDGVELELRVQANGRLRLTTLHVSDNRDAACAQRKQTAAAEVAARQADVAALGRDTLALMQRIKAKKGVDADDLVRDLGELLAVEGHHQERVRELEAWGSLKVSYQRTKKSTFVLLSAGKLAKVPFLPARLVVFREELTSTRVMEDEEVTTVETTLREWVFYPASFGEAEAWTVGSGDEGSGPGEFNHPQGVAVAGDEVFVADCDNHRIVVLDTAGAFVRSFGSHGSGPGQLEHPLGMAVCGEEVFVVDSCNHRIAVFRHNGECVRTFGSSGTGPGQLGFAFGLAVHNGEVFVAEFNASRISVFGLDGTFARSFGSEGSDPGQLSQPTGVAVVGDEVFVAELGNHRVSVFAVDGTFARTFGSEGSGPGKFQDPYQLAASGQTLFVADNGNRRVVVLNPDGSVVRSFASSQRWPRGLAVVGSRVLVAGNHGVVMYQ